MSRKIPEGYEAQTVEWTVDHYESCAHLSQTCPKGEARVNHTVPFYSYAHECACGYWITESELEVTQENSNES